MIQEQYVSFETAKLLKEKGFDIPCSSYYEWYESAVTLFKGYLPEYTHSEVKNYNESENFDIFSRPTQQMASRWLREIHKLHITVFSASQESWMYRITKPHQQLEDGIYAEDFYSYEDAVEAAIKYAIENMIQEA